MTTTATLISNLQAEIAELKRELENERARDIHSCGPDCQRPGCVNRRLRDENEALRTGTEETLEWVCGLEVRMQEIRQMLPSVTMSNALFSLHERICEKKWSMLRAEAAMKGSEMDKLLGCVQMVANMLLRDEKPARAEAAEELKAVAAEVQAELTSLRAFKEACDGLAAMAWRADGRLCLRRDYIETLGNWRGDYADVGRAIPSSWEPIAYSHPDPEAASLRMRVRELERPDFRPMREMLRAMQAGELTVSRGIEILDMWWAGNWSDDMLPPVRQDLIEEDSMPVEIIDRLNARIAELEAEKSAWCNAVQQRDELEAQLSTRDQQVAEACAKAAEDQTRVARECLAGFGDNAVAHCQVAFVIRSGEWKKHMKTEAYRG